MRDALQLYAARREDRGEVFERDDAPPFGRGASVDGLYAAEGEELFLAALGSLARVADRAFDEVAGAEIETANIVWSDIDVFRAGKVTGLLGAEKSEAVGHDFYHAVGDDGSTSAHVCADEVVDDVVLAVGAGEFLGGEEALELLVEGLKGHSLQFPELERGKLRALLLWCFAVLRRLCLAIGLALHLVVVEAVTAVAEAAAATLEAAPLGQTFFSGRLRFGRCLDWPFGRLVVYSFGRCIVGAGRLASDWLERNGVRHLSRCGVRHLIRCGVRHLSRSGRSVRHLSESGVRHPGGCGVRHPGGGGVRYLGGLTCDWRLVVFGWWRLRRWRDRHVLRGGGFRNWRGYASGNFADRRFDTCGRRPRQASLSRRGVWHLGRGVRHRGGFGVRHLGGLTFGFRLPTSGFRRRFRTSGIGRCLLRTCGAACPWFRSRLNGFQILRFGGS